MARNSQQLWKDYEKWANAYLSAKTPKAKANADAQCRYLAGEIRLQDKLEAEQQSAKIRQAFGVK